MNEHLMHTTVGVDLDDQAVRLGLKRLETEYEARMAAISRMRAEAHIGAKTKELDAAIKHAEDELRILRGQKADPEIGLDDKEFRRQSKLLQAEITRLKGERATITIETRGERAAVASIERVAKAEAARAKSEADYHAKRETFAKKAEMDAARQEVRVARLQQRYADLDTEMDKLSKKRTPFGREAQVKLELEKKGLRAEMRATVKELEFYGNHPPPEIKPRMDERGVRRMALGLVHWLERVGNAMQGIGKTKVNVGPLSIGLRTLMVSASLLAPVITSLGGAFTSLIGVMGTAAAGAGVIGGGLFAGLALNIGGAYAALKPYTTQLGIASKATALYNKAVQEHGRDSKEAGKAQEKMQNSMKNMPPAMRRAARSIADVGSEWKKLTKEAGQNALGKAADATGKALHRLMPTLAKNTNQSMRLISNEIDHAMGRMSSKGGIKIFDSLGRSFNKFLAPALDGLTHLGAAFGHIAEAGARLFGGRIGQGFNAWAESIDKATKPSEKLDRQVQRIGNHAADLWHFFTSLGRLLISVFNGGADSGDKMLKSMTATMDRWTKFLNSTKGRNSMAEFFDRSRKTTTELYHALGPLIGAFVKWSNLLAPFTAGIFKGISFVSNLILKITDLVGLGGPLTALGATIGAAFAFAKIGAFIGGISRIATGLKEAYAAGKALGALKFAFGGGALDAMRGRGAAEATAITEAHARGAALLEEAIVGAHTAGAERVGAAEAEGGAVAGTEIGGAMEAAGTAVAAEIGTAEAAGGAAGGAAGLAEGVGGAGLLAGLSEVVLPVAAFAAFTYGMIKLNDVLDQSDEKFDRIVKDFHEGSQNAYHARHSYMALRDSIGDTGSALAHDNISLREAKDRLDHTKKGTMEYRQALLDYRDALRATTRDRQEFTAQTKKMEGFQEREIQGIYRARKANNDEITTHRQRIAWMKQVGIGGEQLRHEEEKLAMATKRGTELNERLNYAYNRRAAAAAQVARAERGMVALTRDAEQAVGQLARTMPKTALKIATKFEDPEDARRVAQATMEAVQSGLHGKAVFKIVADAKDADAAVKRLNKAEIHHKLLTITADDKAARTAMYGLEHMRLPMKVMLMIGNVVDAVRKHGIVANLPNIARTLQMIGNNRDARVKFLQVLGYKITPKIARMLGHDMNVAQLTRVLNHIRLRDKEAKARVDPHPALSVLDIVGRALGLWGRASGTARAGVNPTNSSSVLGSIWSGLMRFAGRTFTAYARVQQMRAEGGPVFASGGVASPDLKAAYEGEPLGARVARNVVQDAANRPVQSANTIGRISRPTFLVGEENRPEYVIATNPAYRKANVMYLKMAAAEFGYDVQPAAGGAIMEDDPRWNWRTMGNHMRGIKIGNDRVLQRADGKVQAEDGSWVPLSYYQHGRTASKVQRQWNVRHEENAMSHIRMAAHEVGAINFRGGFAGGGIPDTLIDPRRGHHHHHKDPLAISSPGHRHDPYGWFQINTGQHILKLPNKYMKGTFDPAMWELLGRWFYPSVANHNIGYSGINEDNIEDVYGKAFGSAAEETRRNLNQLRRNSPKGQRNYFQSQIDRIAAVEEALRRTTRRTHDAKDKWDEEETDIGVLLTKMDLADKNESNQAMYTGPDGKSKLWSYKALRERRQNLLAKHRSADDWMISNLTGTYQQWKEAGVHKSALHYLKEVIGDLITDRDKKKSDEYENALMLPSVDPVTPQTQPISQEQLLEHYNDPDFRVSGLSVPDYVARMEGDIQRATDFGNTERATSLAGTLRNFARSLADMSMGKIENPAVGHKETLPWNWQNAAAAFYAKEQGLLTDASSGAAAQVYGPMVLDTERGRLYREFGGNMAQPTTGPDRAAGGFAGMGDFAGGPFSGPLVSDAGGQFTTGGGQFAQASGITAVRNRISGGTVGLGGAGLANAAPVTHNRIVNVTNSFLTQPSDPLTWSKGVQFDLMM